MWEGGGAEASPKILSSCYYVYKQLPKRTSKIYYHRETREEKTTLRVLHIQKSKLRSFQIYKFSSHYMEAKPPNFSKVVYAPVLKVTLESIE